MLDLRQLRFFIGVAEELHFGRAAARLYITQSALSRQIQGLEQALGVELLARDRRSVRLTEPGQLLLDHARELLAHSQQVEAAVRAAFGQNFPA